MLVLKCSSSKDSRTIALKAARGKGFSGSLKISIMDFNKVDLAQILISSGFESIWENSKKSLKYFVG